MRHQPSVGRADGLTSLPVGSYLFAQCFGGLKKLPQQSIIGRFGRMTRENLEQVLRKFQMPEYETDHVLFAARHSAARL